MVHFEALSVLAGDVPGGDFSISPWGGRGSFSRRPFCAGCLRLWGFTTDRFQLSYLSLLRVVSEIGINMGNSIHINIYFTTNSKSSLVAFAISYCLH